MNKIRDNTLLKLQKLVSNTNSKKIEESIFNFSQKYSIENDTPFLLNQIYETKANELLCILTGNNGKNLKKLIELNKIDISQIAFLKPDELDPKSYSKIKEKNKVIDLKKNIGTDAYECKKCKKRKCSVSERQIRSGDEPATLFIKCLECDYTYTIN